MSVCQRAQGPPIWHRVSDSPANTHAPSTEREGRETWQSEKRGGGGVELVVERKKRESDRDEAGIVCVVRAEGASLAK